MVVVVVKVVLIPGVRLEVSVHVAYSSVFVFVLHSELSALPAKLFGMSVIEDRPSDISDNLKIKLKITFL